VAGAVDPCGAQACIACAYDIQFRIVADVQDLIGRDTELFGGSQKDARIWLCNASVACADVMRKMHAQTDALQIGVAVGQTGDRPLCSQGF
jgi:hypothetical protein